ncbi:hypothetical protein SPRG_20684 [Saprolegnia parasitica CBS 223.65]|uniref:Peptidase S1 domain-containing protein n=1 Tax=Saprolegnia parasitica (strain CBS 223.65) TaxID=695850 RepID=A0A067C459_SAPPC|nr:hypothetical protein SPRG_20684 [Saprolegnia parasitica CBS 223.65]KDO25564.1 hypothetical protein SPRG_20684 [Saprolegnia parasitica CBS 223.65]|eukprot:XP_012203783.1 hypothetical protein SPRG_20684 [Saprolegnia parasitica CBS 223.65]
MVRITSLALLASAAIAAPISYLKVQHKTKQTEGIEIVGGKEAEIGKHLYVSGLREVATGPNYCGGAVISPTTILTAGHCAYGDWIKYVSIGSHYLSGSKDGERIQVKKIVLHPKFNYDTMVYDFAILELANATTVTPIEVLFDEKDAAGAPGVLGMARGWGTTSSGGSQSNVLKEVGLKLWSNTDCRAAFDKLNNPSVPPIDVAMICAGGVQGEDTCQGDSGGPLTVTKNGKDVLVGLTSWGLGCAQAGLPGVYARLSYAKEFLAPYLPKPACEG